MYRFEYVVKMNIQSIQACDPSKMATLDMRPHYVSIIELFLCSLHNRPDKYPISFKSMVEINDFSSSCISSPG